MKGFGWDRTFPGPQEVISYPPRTFTWQASQEALIKEYEEYLKRKLGPERYEEYLKRKSTPR